MYRGCQFLSLVLMCAFVVTVFCEALNESETNPDGQKTTVAEHLGSALSKEKQNERHKRKLVDIRSEEIAASHILGPSIFVGHVGDYGGYGEQGYGGLGGENFGLVKSAGDFYGNQNIGSSQGEIGFYGVGGSRGGTNLASANSYGGSNAAKQGSGSDAGYYGNAVGARRGHNVGNAYYGDQAYNQNGAAVQGIGSKGGHRKGHHTAGFHNTYHKDESGKTSTFYDDGADEGGHYSYDARDGIYRDGAANVQGGGFQDGAYLDNQQARQGNYGASAAFDALQGNKGLHSSGQYLDDQQRYGLGKSANKYGRKAYTGQEGGGDSYYTGGGSGYDYGHGGGANVYHNGPPAVTGGYLIPATGYGFYEKKASTLHPQEYYPVKSGKYYSPRVISENSRLAAKDFDGLEQTVKGVATFVDKITHPDEILLPDQYNSKRVYFDPVRY
ncbi:hypothetical protein PR048_008520 [Dryococelus australis]|uniref:Uncharacterized protein n=1 Tax=Dryococelus australis TaxID=614101 RepID=A0ABQ9HY49_9NEOP|nr:hypothetical protein PR048_008520 [Dryococelus australis]